MVRMLALTGSKQYDFLIIPRQPGDYKIDSRTHFHISTLLQQNM